MSTTPSVASRRASVPEGFPGRVSFVKSAAKLAQAPHSTLPEICICGRSNVGKSSLINALTHRRQLARASSTPGRTRLLNFFNIQDRLMLVDLPGYGWAKVPIGMKIEWGKAIQAYLNDRLQLRLAVLLLDIRRDPSRQDKELYAWFTANDRPCLLVGTKADKVPVSQRGLRIKALAKAMGAGKRDVIPVSATTKTGCEALWSILLGHADDAAADDADEENDSRAEAAENPNADDV